MSYCRWSECDVYAYDSCEGGVRFWVADDSFNRLCGTYNEAYQYAKELRDKHGFNVPSHAIDALREDAIDEAKQHLGPDGAVADVLAENAKLRELVRDMWSEGMCECGSLGKCESCIYDYPSRMRDLGVEVVE